MSESGITLVSVLFALTVSLLLTAALFFSYFVDALAASNGSAGDDALYVAEAGVQHLWSVLEPAPDFARELSWPSGEPPFGAVVPFPAPPRTYRVRVAPRPDGGLEVTSEGTSHRGTRRRIEAIFVREDRFRPPASLMIAPGADLDVAGVIDVSAAEAERATPAVGAERRREAESAIARLPQEAEVAVVGPTGLGHAATELLGAGGISLEGEQAGGEWGSAESPALVRLGASLDFTGAAHITGIVIIDGLLQLDGRLEIDGLLLAPEGIDVSGDLVVRGAAWFAGRLRVPSSATLAVAYSPATLDDAAAVGGGALPKAPHLSAWREIW